MFIPPVTLSENEIYWMIKIFVILVIVALIAIRTPDR